MNVVPQTVFRMYKGIPFNGNYDHQILFDSISQQENYFNARLAYSVTDFTHIKQNNSVRIPAVADEFYDCNYCAFQNVGFGSKWFYAFINKIEYINTETTEIFFEVDYFQTWLFDFSIQDSFVLREHVADDTVGKHTVQENLPIGDYIISKQQNIVSGSGVAVYALPANFLASITANVYTPLLALGTTNAGISELNTFLEQFLEHPERVASITMISDKMTKGGTAIDNLKSFVDTFTVARAPGGGFVWNGDSYIPKNNKLYCYPYCLFTVDNYNGELEEYKWEDFANPHSTQFVWQGTPVPKPCMIAYPMDYKGEVSATQYGVTYTNFPQCPYASDTFKAWVSNNGAKMLSSSLENTVQTAVMGALAGGPTGALVSSVVSSATNSFNNGVSYQYAKLHSKSIRGTVGDAGFNWAFSHIGFRTTNFTIKPEYARIIDDYFTRFGYEVDRYKVPELRSRQSFNYVRTREVLITGNIPNDASELISNIFNRGVTLWHNTAVGNYALCNDCVPEGVKFSG